MVPAKVVFLVCAILAMSLSLAVDRDRLIERALIGNVVPEAWSSNFDANRPMSTCGTNASGQANSGMRGSSTTNNADEEGDDTPACPTNFGLSISPSNIKQAQGSTGVVHVSLTYLSGTSPRVTMLAQGAPAATEVSFAPNSGRPTFSSAMTITTRAETPQGRFNITILARGGGLEKSVILSLEVVSFPQNVPPIHDIAIVAASVQGSATVGGTVMINATVSNHGSVSETFELQAYANTTRVADQSGLKLASAATSTDRLIWNTTGYSPGTYRITVSVPQVQGELNLLDNSREAGMVILTQTPGSGPSPSPAASGNGQGFTYGRQLAIVAAIAEVAVVFLVVLRSRGKISTGKGVGRS